MYSKKTSIKERVKFVIEKIYEHYNKVDLKKAFENKIYYDGILMAIFQTINYTIDLIDLILAINNEKLTYYKEGPKILEGLKIIDKKLANCLIELIQYRNIIAHEYHVIEKEELEYITNLLTCIDDFVDIVEKKIL